MLLKLPDLLRQTCTLPFLDPFFDLVMIIRLNGLLQIKFPRTASKCIFFFFFFFFFVAVFLGCTSTGRVGLCFLWFYVQELPKAQPAVFLVLKRLRRRGNGLKSHPTDWEKPGIEPATPGLQDIGLSPTPWRLVANKCHAYVEKGVYS